MPLKDVPLWSHFWNSCYGDKLFLSEDVIKFSFSFSNSSQVPVVLSNSHFHLLCKREGSLFRLHLPVPIQGASVKERGGEAFEIFRNEARRSNCHWLVFGAGDRHLFPGVPQHRDLECWQNWFTPKGPRAVDFQGNLTALKAKSSSEWCEGILRNSQNATEEAALLHFVQTEFPGRWTREIQEDTKNNLLNHYFGYFINDTIVGYARLYGWSGDYKGPGTHFAQPGEKMGALGPIGVASQMRGHGLGGQILKASWDILLNKGCQNVRIDWTTEIDFYRRRGMEIVQEYQPAELEI